MGPPLVLEAFAADLACGFKVYDLIRRALPVKPDPDAVVVHIFQPEKRHVTDGDVVEISCLVVVDTFHRAGPNLNRCHSRPVVS
jgi:hypothetical protein